MRNQVPGKWLADAIDGAGDNQVLAFVGIAKVEEFTGRDRRTIQRLIRAQQFPPPADVVLGKDGLPRTYLWDLATLLAWRKQRMESALSAALLYATPPAQYADKIAKARAAKQANDGKRKAAKQEVITS